MIPLFKHTALFVLGLTLLFTACERIWVESSEPDLESPDQKEVVELINGIYYLLAEVHNENYFYLLSRSDDVNIFSNLTDRCQFGACNLETVVEDFYQNIYRAIISANLLEETMDPQEQPYLYGEVLFLNAYCYFKLSRLFYRPPDIDNYSVQYNIPLFGRPEIYRFIEEKLQYALSLLPEGTEEVQEQTPGIHRGMANALLAELYLSWAGYPVRDNSKYSLAAYYAGEVIRGWELPDYPLAEDPESDLLFGIETATGQGFTNRIYPFRLVTVTNDSIYDIQSVFVPGFNYYFNYPEGPGKEMNFRMGDYKRKLHLSPEGNYYLYELEKADSTLTYWDFAHTVFYRKWLNEKDIVTKNPGYSSTGTGVDLVLLRYSQTLLTWAEARAAMDQADPEVFEAINSIRRRARGFPVKGPSPVDLPYSMDNKSLLDSIRQERAWELCFEPEGRWFDVVRLELLGELDRARNPKDQVVSFEAQLSPDPYFLGNPQQDEWLIEEIEKSERK